MNYQIQTAPESATDLVQQLFSELVKVNRIVRHWREKLEEKLPSPASIITAHRQLMDALETRNEIFQMLNQEYSEPITLQKLNKKP